VLFHHDSSAAPQTVQTVQTASPVCGTKNFVSVRLYSAPQLHRTIVTILPSRVEGRFLLVRRFVFRLYFLMLDGQRSIVSGHLSVVLSENWVTHPFGTFFKRAGESNESNKV
jgi:hypothetical protein